MTDPNAHPLAVIVRKLGQRTQLDQAETDVLIALPYRAASINTGDHLIREGDRADGCIALLSGFAYLSKIAGDGSRQILGIHLQGDLIGLQAALLHRADHSIQAMTPARVAYIPHQAIIAAAHAHPAIATALWRESFVDTSVASEWLLNVGQRDARRRIAHLLCEIALRQEATGACQPPDYVWPLTQEQVGDATGLTSVHVNRTLQALRADSLIQLSRQRLTITDWPRLRAAGDFSPAYLHLPALPHPVPQRLSA